MILPERTPLNLNTASPEVLAATITGLDRALALLGSFFNFQPSTFNLQPSPWSPLAGWQFNVVVGGVVTFLLMLGEWAFRLGLERWFQWAAFAQALEQ